MRETNANRGVCKVNGKPSFSSRDYSVSDGADPMLDAVKELLRELKITDPGVRVMSLDVVEGVANLHFSEGFTGGEGSMDEATLLYGLRAVLGQFRGVTQLRLFEEGKQVTELGHIEFGDTLDTIPVNRWGDPGGTTDEASPPSMPR